MQKRSNVWISFMPNALLLIMGFLFTTVAGGFFTNYYQDKKSKESLVLSSAQSDIEDSMKFFTTISPLMDQRSYRMRQLQFALSGDASDNAQLADYTAAYRNLLFVWNSSLNENLALYQYYFHDKGYNDDYFEPRLGRYVVRTCPHLFVHQQNDGFLDLLCIQAGFIKANDALNQIKSDDKTDSKKFLMDLMTYSNILDILQEKIFDLDQVMLGKIQYKSDNYKDNLGKSVLHTVNG